MRKHKVVKIDAEGRDHGKNFLVLEKSAYDAERWAMRALLALGKAGVEIPDDAMQAGALGILAIGLTAFRQLAFEDAEMLLDEMMACVAFVPDTSRMDPVTQRPMSRPLIAGDDGDIEEVATLLRLRGEALELHLGFSVTAALSNIAAAVTSRPQATPTSRKSSGRSSRRAKRAS